MQLKTVKLKHLATEFERDDVMVTIEPAEKLPYVRTLLDVRVCSSDFQTVAPGWLAEIDGVDYTVLEHDYCPDMTLSIMSAVLNTTTPTILNGNGDTAEIKQPKETFGDNATTTDETVSSGVEVVIADVEPKDTENEEVTVSHMLKRIYLERQNAEQLRPNWTIVTPSARYKVFSVHGLSDCRYLPFAVAERSGLPR